MLVSRFSHDYTAALFSNSFFVLNNRFRNNNFNTTTEVLAEIFETDFQMKFSNTSHDIFTSFLITDAQNTRI